MREAHQCARWPFCNGRDLTMDVTQCTFNVRCFECGASGPDSTSKARAVSYWNGTADDINISAMVVELRTIERAINNRNDRKYINL